MQRTGQNIYDENTFYDAFELDLENAKGLVLIQSPFLRISKINKLRYQLERTIRRGVRICVFAQEPLGWQDHKKVSNPEMKPIEGAIELLQSLQIHTTLRKRIHQKVIVVDDLILWDGSLNLLSHTNTKERMTRWQDAELVSSTIRTYKLNRCDHCRGLPESWTSKDGRMSSAQRIDFFCGCIKQRRLEAKLTQKALAERAGVAQQLISDIERGNRNAEMNTLFRICDALDMQLIAAPRYQLPAILNRPTFK